jgi:hypothetical protein
MIVAYVTDYKIGEVVASSTMNTGVWKIFENTTREVVNDQGAELWTCSLTFDIPIKYNNEFAPGHHARWK